VMLDVMSVELKSQLKKLAQLIKTKITHCIIYIILLLI
jgi:hypothetical protein